MGKGKLIKFQELESFDHVIQAPYRINQDTNFELKGKWAFAFFKNSNPIILELGCGKGEYTVKLAEKFPTRNYIGIDIKGARIWRGAKQTLEKGLKNVGFIRTNIEIINRFFAPNEVDEIWLTFPDPQMKKTNKRLTSTKFISKYKKILVDNGIIHLKTDSNFQFRYTSAMVNKNNFKVISKTDNLYNSDLLNEELNIKTYYENQWLNRGLTIKYIAFGIHKNEPYWEPDIKIEKDNYRSFGRNTVNIQHDE